MNKKIQTVLCLFSLFSCQALYSATKQIWIRQNLQWGAAVRDGSGTYVQNICSFDVGECKASLVSLRGQIVRAVPVPIIVCTQRDIYTKLPCDGVRLEPNELKGVTVNMDAMLRVDALYGNVVVPYLGKPKESMEFPKDFSIPK